MGALDTLISIGIVITFFAFIGSKVYNHEKENLDPLIKKIKGWFTPDEREEELDPNSDFEIAFRGQL